MGMFQVVVPVEGHVVGDEVSSHAWAAEAEAGWAAAQGREGGAKVAEQALWMLFCVVRDGVLASMVRVLVGGW